MPNLCPCLIKKLFCPGANPRRARALCRGPGTKRLSERGRSLPQRGAAEQQGPAPGSLCRAQEPINFMWSCKTLADGLNCWLNPAAALPRETVPRSLDLVSDSSGWLGTKPAPAAVSPLPQLSGEGVKVMISALLAVMYGFGSGFCVVALMWDGERKLQALLLCLFLSRGLLTVAGCLEELCACSMRGGKGLVLLQE